MCSPARPPASIPDVDALTHAKISTGKAENKFGVTIDEARRWFAASQALSHVRLDGLHVHIGSQILHLDPLRQALHRVAGFRRELAEGGQRIASIDVGGGLGVVYRTGLDRPIAVQDYVRSISEALADFHGADSPGAGPPSRSRSRRTDDAGHPRKHTTDRHFLVVDAAMNDLLRPCLYDAWHDIVPFGTTARNGRAYDIVGPVCETGDTFAQARALAALCGPATCWRSVARALTVLRCLPPTIPGR